MYHALMRALENGGEPHVADRDLLAALRQLATEAQHPNPSDAAADTYLSVQDAIEQLRYKKSREQRKRQRRARERAARQQRLVPTHEHAARLVRMKAHQLGIGYLRKREDKAIKLMQKEMPIDRKARRVQVGNLNRIEQRAVEIVRGARAKSRMDRIEIKAITLANEVKTEWFTPQTARPRGRPKGSMIGTTKDKPDQLSSVSEVIFAVSPPIQKLAGAAASPSAMIAAVEAAVRVAGLHCPADLANLASKVRRRRTYQ